MNPLCWNLFVFSPSTIWYKLFSNCYNFLTNTTFYFTMSSKSYSIYLFLPSNYSGLVTGLGNRVRSRKPSVSNENVFKLSVKNENVSPGPTQGKDGAAAGGKLGCQTTNLSTFFTFLQRFFHLSLTCYIQDFKKIMSITKCWYIKEERLIVHLLF